VRRGYDWLGHEHGVTEVAVIHPEYRPRDNAWNRSHESWPLTHYVTSHVELLRIVKEYAGERLVCYGLNPRPSKLSHQNGRVRSAKEADFAISQNLLLDIDLQGGLTRQGAYATWEFLNVADDYFRSLGVTPPVRAFTGRGYHLLFAYPPIPVRYYPDLRGQLKTFKDDFAAAHQHDLNRLEARVDSTQDLRRMVRVYGTSKPTVGIPSTFPDTTRRPDERLREYLLGLTPATVPPLRSIAKYRTLPDLMPAWFPPLLAQDRVLNELWHNRGKPKTSDQSNSGYDYTIACYLAQQHHAPEDIIMILAMRPTGNAERAAKGIDYVIRTVENAAARQRQQKRNEERRPRQRRTAASQVATTTLMRGGFAASMSEDNRYVTNELKAAERHTE
jgi:hypothetical protein